MAVRPARRWTTAPKPGATLFTATRLQLDGRALAANYPLNKANGGTRPFENNNQWAASLGGPIRKDKAYFFVNTEGIRYIFGSIQNVSVPPRRLKPSCRVTFRRSGHPGVLFKYLQALQRRTGIGNAKPNPNSCPGFATAPGATGGVCTEKFYGVGLQRKQGMVAERTGGLHIGENDSFRTGPI